MNPNNESENLEEFSEETEIDEMASIDEFIKELEAREKDLHISEETVIEIEDFDLDDDFVNEFPLEDPSEDILPNIVLIEPLEPVAGKGKKRPMIKPPATDIINKTKIFELEREIQRLKEKNAKMEAESAEVFELSRRRQNDFENYKKRTERDKDSNFSKQLGNLAIGILPVLDNLDRAMGVASNLPHEKSLNFQKFYDGIVLVNNQLNEVLSEMGVKPIQALNESFDPHFHEAVATEESEKHESNTIIGELLRGYLLGDKVIRPSMVKVATSSRNSDEVLESESDQIKST